MIAPVLNRVEHYVYIGGVGGETKAYIRQHKVAAVFSCTTLLQAPSLQDVVQGGARHRLNGHPTEAACIHECSCITLLQLSMQLFLSVANFKHMGADIGFKAHAIGENEHPTGVQAA